MQRTASWTWNITWTGTRRTLPRLLQTDVKCQSMALCIMLFAGRMSSSEGHEGHDPIPRATQFQLHHQTNFVRLVDVGEANRFASSTKLNIESSRSHAMLLVGTSSFSWLTCTISRLLFLQSHLVYFSSHKLMHEIALIMSK